MEWMEPIAIDLGSHVQGSNADLIYTIVNVHNYTYVILQLQLLPMVLLANGTI